MTRSKFLVYHRIAVCGDFGQHTTDKIKNWIHNAGGQYVGEFKPNITHLVCSKEAHRKKVKMVQQAREIPAIHIVSFDWLEDTINNKRPQKSSLYYIGRKMGKEAKKRNRVKEIKQGIQQFEKGCQDFQEEMHSNGYHLYRDPTYFEYTITLVRAQLETNTHQAWHLKPSTSVTSNSLIRVPPFSPLLTTLQLYESHAIPRRYASYAKPSSRQQTVPAQMIAPINSSFEVAFEGFKKFFHLKTGRDWARRLCVAGQGQGEGRGQEDGMGEVKVEVEKEPERDIDTMEGWYNYRVPMEGPKGVIGGEDLMVKVAEQTADGVGDGKGGEQLVEMVRDDVGGEAAVADTVATDYVEKMEEGALEVEGLRVVEA